MADGGTGPTSLGSPCDDRANPTRPADGRAAAVTPDPEDLIETEACHRLIYFISTAASVCSLFLAHFDGEESQIDD